MTMVTVTIYNENIKDNIVALNEIFKDVQPFNRKWIGARYTITETFDKGVKINFQIDCNATSRTTVLLKTRAEIQQHLGINIREKSTVR